VRARGRGSNRPPTRRGIARAPNVCVPRPPCVHSSFVHPHSHPLSTMNRREFIATAAVASTGPILLGTSKKAEDKNPVIGVEGHKYECIHNWGELPGEFEWQTTHNVALDSAGNVYVTHQGLPKKKGMDTVFVFDPKGKFVRSFGKDWHGGGHGIEIRKEGSGEVIYFS